MKRSFIGKLLEKVFRKKPVSFSRFPETLFRPEFASKYDEFSTERLHVSTSDQVIAFSRRWLDSSIWPKWELDERKLIEAATLELVATAEDQTGIPWAPIFYVYSLHAIDRYEVFLSYEMFLEIRFPHLKGEKKSFGTSQWHRDCYFCSITSWSEEQAVCPICDRELTHSWLGD